MTHLDYAPAIDGVPADPGAAGGSVEKLLLYPTIDRGGEATLEVGPAVRVAPYRYRFAVPTSATGRYYPRVLWKPTGAAAQITDDLMPYVDLPIRDDLVISPETLATKLGVPLPISAAQRETLTDIIRDAQDDVVTYLGRPIVPQMYTERRLWPGPGGWVLSQSPVVDVLAETAEVDENGRETGFWTVVYRAGLDVRNDEQYRPIKRVVTAQALEHRDAQTLWSTVGSGVGGANKRIKSLGTEGQSASFTYLTAGGLPEDATKGEGVVGGAIRWNSIDTWRIRGRRVFTRKDAFRDTFVQIVP